MHYLASAELLLLIFSQKDRLQFLGLCVEVSSEELYNTAATVRPSGPAEAAFYEAKRPEDPEYVSLVITRRT